MLTARVIPCLDVQDARVVKGVRFAGLRDAGDPAGLAARYQDEGADEVVVLDVAATPRGRAHQLGTVRAVRSVLGIPLTVGGGVRSRADARALLEAGADRVAVNTAAVRRPELLTELADEFGVQCVVLALDARAVADPRAGAAGRHEVLVRSGGEATGLGAAPWAARAARLGAGEILVTSHDRDGTRSGYDLELIAAVARAVPVPVVASGGAAHPEHLLAALRAGADAVLAASIFHDAEHSIHAVKEHLHAHGVPVRRADRLLRPIPPMHDVSC